ncbi:Creatinase/aminopeptidase [Hortaea werneckii]|nr:Creatinase/aminopeptidase [Hortaea werneckii]KAI7001347.1 Creatinase/aminopeptidase [Hortaea werneckii]KAI7148913.1 Creatinase/aminopeptidase [Hortaea werneckii]KAI7178629.1 Creatinase/aminopeptidase [Hortaea werneckii]
MSATNAKIEADPISNMKGAIHPEDASAKQEAAAVGHRGRYQRMLLLAAAALCWIMWANGLFAVHIDSHEKWLSDIQSCAIGNLKSDLYFLDSAEPIHISEFVARRDNLARALHATSVPAFVMEPGYTSQYYANLSQFDWEPWEPEERPMLVIVQPQLSSSGEVVAKTSILAPAFEVGRVRMLGIPGFTELDQVIGWEEHWDPYETLRKSGLFTEDGDVLLMMDEEIRDYIVRGLDRSGFETVGLGGEAEAVRQVKSPREVELLRAVNTGTVEAVRAVRKCLEPGVTEDEVTRVLDNTMSAIGFAPFFDIVLFEEDGALPHGGFVTGSKVLNEDTMVVIDVGAHYLGYSSDICRSFFIPPRDSKSFWSFIPQWLLSSKTAASTDSVAASSDPLHAEKLKVWHTVLEAQTASAKQFKPNATAASVDIAARRVITDAGYGEYFTHRVGHGIGIKAHESPYLNKANVGTRLRAGMTFTSEPGIYVLDKFGVRHEDIFLVKESGEAEVLTGKRPISPWEP